MINITTRILTADQVREIRAWWEARKQLPPPKKKAAQMGISTSTLYSAALRRHYKEIR